MRILLVEDEEYMAQAVAQVLGKNNYTVDLAHDGEYGLDCALSVSMTSSFWILCCLDTAV